MTVWRSPVLEVPEYRSHRPGKAVDEVHLQGRGRRLGISPGGAGRHATVLPQAGPVVSHRRRNTVRHTPAGLGADLLNAP
ncbi:MAG: hypothetical protein ABW046_18000 [Actinoplanes sp.]